MIGSLILVAPGLMRAYMRPSYCGLPKMSVQKGHKGRWTYVVWQNSVKFLGTRGLVKVRGTIDGHPFKSSFMAMSDTQHMLPVKVEIRRTIGMEVGEP